MLLVVFWIVEYIQDKVLRVSGLQILVCCSYPWAEDTHGRLYTKHEKAL